jgi:hypothetical protein
MSGPYFMKIDPSNRSAGAGAHDARQKPGVFSTDGHGMESRSRWLTLRLTASAARRAPVGRRPRGATIRASSGEARTRPITRRIPIRAARSASSTTAACGRVSSRRATARNPRAGSRATISWRYFLWTLTPITTSACARARTRSSSRRSTRAATATATAAAPRTGERPTRSST